MDTRKLILFFIFSFSAMMLWQGWQPKPSTVAATDAKNAAIQDIPTAPVASQATTNSSMPNESALQLAKGDNIQVETDVYKLIINTIGGDIRFLELKAHKDADNKNKNLVLMDDTPPTLYVTQSGLIGNDLPNHKTAYTSQEKSYQLQPGQDVLTVVLNSTNANGVEVSKSYSFKRNSYQIALNYQIKNNTAAAIPASVYYQFLHDSESNQGTRLMPTFTGGAYFTGADKYKKISFSDMAKDPLNKTAQDGWVALVQHYFVSAWIPKQDVTREYYTKKLSSNVFSVGSVSNVGNIQPGATLTIPATLYTGPQIQDQMEKAAPGLEYVVDYGWLKFIASPLFWVLSKIESLVHNWGVAIIILTVLLKLAFFHLSATSYRSMAHMRELAPRLQKMKEQYGDDRLKMQQAMMELYRKEKINPMSGCLPILIQIPVFIALYYVLLGSVELRNAPFFGWIQDLSAKDPFYILPVLMGLSMIIQTRLNPTPPDPIQAKVMQIMPIMMSIFFFFFPAGLVLYWLVNNILSIAQQWYINKTVDAHIAKKRAANQ